MHTHIHTQRTHREDGWHTHTHTHTEAGWHTHTTSKHTNTHTQRLDGWHRARSHTHTHTHTQRQVQIYRQTRTHRETETCTHTYTHTHTFNIAEREFNSRRNFVRIQLRSPWFNVSVAARAIHSTTRCTAELLCAVLWRCLTQ